MSNTGPLLPGQPVTLVLPDHVVMVEVTSSERDKFHCTLTTRGGKQIDSIWKLDEESVGWLRGYYLADSPEVNAARTAQALAPSPAAVNPQAGNMPPAMQAAKRALLQAATVSTMIGNYNPRHLQFDPEDV